MAAEALLSFRGGVSRDLAECFPGGREPNTLSLAWNKQKKSQSETEAGSSGAVNFEPPSRPAVLLSVTVTHALIETATSGISRNATELPVRSERQCFTISYCLWRRKKGLGSDNN